jgi:hypothetical protein
MKTVLSGLKCVVPDRIIVALGILALLVVFASGCASAPAIDPNEMAKQFYNQERHYKVLQISGVTELAVKGANIQLAVEAEMTPLSVMPKDPSTAQAVISAVERTLTIGAGIITAGKVMENLADQPPVEPLVVRPEVIMVE